MSVSNIDIGTAYEKLYFLEEFVENPKQKFPEKDLEKLFKCIKILELSLSVPGFNYVAIRIGQAIDKALQGMSILDHAAYQTYRIAPSRVFKSNE